MFDDRRLATMFGDQSQAGGVYSSALLVGGLCCEDDCLQDSDTVALVQSVKWINQNLDVCIAANPKVDVCNLDYGSNFFELGSEDNYDFVVFCNLYFSGLGNPEHSFFSLSRQSELAFDRENWKKSIEHISPKAILNCHVVGEPEGQAINDVLASIIPYVSDSELYRGTTITKQKISGFAFDALRIPEV
ncbi:MAG: hypothetical protein H6859_02665 [Rhodospirillales bacterium]|nr:hypothetical protein [Alphaproteobacteria bacterium]USO06115.1 MAG: hypothetical protein H6859_02665 [Rhodospirillales bacterium]